MNIEEVEEPETTKIHTQHRGPTSAPPPKLRKFTDKTNMQARKHENSDEFRPAPRSSTRPFTITVRTPSVKHTVCGKKVSLDPRLVSRIVIGMGVNMVLKQTKALGEKFLRNFLTFCDTHWCIKSGKTVGTLQTLAISSYRCYFISIGWPSLCQRQTLRILKRPHFFVHPWYTEISL